jgi:peptidoglycan LD-endopeptidase CwlK
MPREFDENTLSHLVDGQVHLDLIKLTKAAYPNAPLAFEVRDGLRTIKEQELYFRTGKSRTMQSRHLAGGPLNVSRAIDIVVLDTNGDVTWELQSYRRVAAHFKAWAKKLNIAIVWGGDWKSIVDGPHIELDRNIYP